MSETLDEMLGKKLVRDNMEILMYDFGLTYNQAKMWLEQEPNYFTIRRIFTDKKNRRGLYRT